MGGQQSRDYVQNPNQNLGLQVANSSVVGRNYLTDTSGRALYVYTKDPANVSVCSGNCATEWPPVIVPVSLPGSNVNGNNMSMQNIMSSFSLAPGINRSKLSTITRNDGTSQLTLNNWPLYYYYLDSAPGDIKGQTVKGIWYLIGPDGNPIVTPLIQGNQSVTTMPYPDNSDMSETAAVLTPSETSPVSYSENWKGNVGFRNFRHYYRWKKWRHYAYKNKYDWQNYTEWNRWYKDNRNKWNDDHIRGVYRVWLESSDNDWEDYNSWHGWNSRNINHYY